MTRLVAAFALALSLCPSLSPADPLPAYGDPAGTINVMDLLDKVMSERNGIILDAACCKTCRSGKACGDSCISRDKACHKGAGCACNG